MGIIGFLHDSRQFLCIPLFHIAVYINDPILLLAGEISPGEFPELGGRILPGEGPGIVTMVIILMF